jgi:L-lactate dehydrogenase complex protein LldF
VVRPAARPVKSLRPPGPAHQGARFRWSSSRAQARQVRTVVIVTRLGQATGASAIVKVKSLATQEIGFNEAPAVAGMTAETHLAEPIVQ